MGRLLIGQDSNNTFYITKDVTTIGRGPTNELILEDELISRNHAKIIRSGPKVQMVLDLDSRNGIFVNEIRVKEKVLEDGDLIRLGKSLLLYQETASKEVVLTDDQPFPEEASGTIIKPLTEFSTEVAPVVEATPAGIDPLQRERKRFWFLTKVGETLHSVRSPRELLEDIMDLVFQVLEAERGFLMLKNETTGELIPQVIKYRKPLGAETETERITISKTIANKVIHDKVAVLTSDARVDPRFSSGESILLYDIRSAMCVPLWRQDKVMGIIYLDSFMTTHRFTEEDLDLLSIIGNQAAISIENAQLQERIIKEMKLRDNLGRYLSSSVVDSIMAGGDSLKLGGEEREATILFSDIRGFTPISERLEAQEVVFLLNEYFSAMTEIVFKFEGTLDKYMGDAIMAVFGAPLSHPDDPERSVRTALEMQRILKDFMKAKPEYLRFGVGIGINTGKVIAGNIGSLRRMDYTVISDAVNVAARLQAMSEGGQVLIGKDTYEYIKDKFQTRSIGSVTVKGKKKSVEVYEVLGPK